MAAQHFTSSQVRQMVCDSGEEDVDSDIEIEVIIYGTFTVKSEAMRACYHHDVTCNGASIATCANGSFVYERQLMNCYCSLTYVALCNMHTVVDGTTCLVSFFR